jgi:flagellar basal body L-ring protein FlgH
MAKELKTSWTALARLTAAQHRLEARKARTDMREWQIKRRERTRQLIELGGLVVKAELVELTDDDRATLFGAFLTVAIKLRSEAREQALAIWKRKGKRAFEDQNSTPLLIDERK